MKTNIVGIGILFSLPVLAWGLDNDGNGVSDVWEDIYGIAPLTSDTDADGYTYVEECRLGTDPHDSNSPGTNWFRIKVQASLLQPVIHLEIDTNSTIQYQLQSSWDLSPGSWTAEGDPFPGDVATILMEPIQDLGLKTTQFWRIQGLGGLADMDGDQLDSWEEMALGTNPIKFDSDEDRLSDSIEFLAQTNPLSNADGDSDSLADDWEMYYFGNFTRDGTLDFDGDEISDGAEFALALSPVNGDTDGDRITDDFEINNSMDANVANVVGANGEIDESSLPSSAFIVDTDQEVGFTHTTIQAALDAVASDYQLIIVREGIYPENLVISNPYSVALISQSGAQTTTIIGSDTTQPVLYTLATSRVAIDGFTLANGKEGLVVQSSGSVFSRLVIKDCATDALTPLYCLRDDNEFNRILIANTTTRLGAIYLNSALNTILRHVTLFGNFGTDSPAPVGHGLYLRGNSVSNPTSVTIENSILWNNPFDPTGANEVYIEGAYVTTSQSDSIIKGGFGGALNTDPLLQLGSDGFLTAAPAADVLNQITSTESELDILMTELPPGNLNDLGAEEWQ
ncbi:MAG: hypothetical protein AAGA18_14475 [Verrucomicrobiota bacterium]